MEKVVSYIFIPLILCYFAVEFILIMRSVIYSNWPEAVDTFTRFTVLLSGGCFVYLMCGWFYNRFCKFYRLFFPCAGLLVLGIGLWRLIGLIAQYGLTERRYFTIFGIAVFAIFLIFMLLDMTNRGRLAAMVLSAFLVVSVLPFVNYHTVSAYSQMMRAEQIMNRYGMLTEDGIKPPATMSESDRLELSRAVQYLVEKNETVMAKWLPVHFDFPDDYATVFGVAGEFDSSGQSTMIGKTYMGTLADKYYTVDGFDIVLSNYTTYNLFNFSAKDIVGVKGTYTLRFSQVAGDSLVAVVTRNGETVAQVDVTDQLDGTAKYMVENVSNDSLSVAMPLEQMLVEFDTPAVRVRVVLKSVSVSVDNISRGLSTALTDIILIDEK